VFSPRIFPNDPLAAVHVLSSGEVLARVAERYRISPELIASVNNIANMNVVRVGQRLKVLNGPLHAVVHKSRFEIWVYLGDTLIERFPVGLGVEGSTPTGRWQVSEKLTNPTYYPPRGGAVVAADDPQNPLGEHWIALQGVEGESVGQSGYGIHGTNEPHTIGKNASLGCIRLHNEDVARLYTMLARNESTVTIVE
jgi:lipoprotein-anchoring transpeptidase ErfK/SrfK